MLAKPHLLAAAATLAAILCAASPAVSEDSDPIDRDLQDCLDRPGGQTTSGMVSCTGAAIKAYDVQLNQTYRSTLSALDPKSAALLRKAERQWVAFRTAERELWEAPWRETRGTVVRLQLMHAELSATKQRISELQVYVPGAK